LRHEETWCQALELLTSELQVLARIKARGMDTGSRWDWLISPVPEYLEGAGGPVVFSEIEWVELNMTRTVPRGRLISDAKIDVSVELLKRLQNFHFSTDTPSNVVRIFPPTELHF
jgi:hypothetical protein